MGGLTSKTPDVEREADPTKKDEIKTDWLAEAGVYSWDWKEVMDDNRVTERFTNATGFDAAKQNVAMQKFSEAYDKAEIDARVAEKSSDIFRIYFPEPATRISPAAINLLLNAGLGDLKITAGEQLGRKRESIGLIAALVYLDKKNNTNNQLSRSKAKLRLNTSYRVKTGLGKRKGEYISVFVEWLDRADQGNGAFKDIDIGTLNSAKAFDQSYLKPGTADDVLSWHNNTLSEMENSDASMKNTFFKPKA